MSTTHPHAFYLLVLMRSAELTWERAVVAMELGRLAQGDPGLVEGTNTQRFIHLCDKPADYISSYCRTVYSINMYKATTHRVRLTYDGDRSDYQKKSAHSQSTQPLSSCI